MAEIENQSPPSHTHEIDLNILEVDPTLYEQDELPDKVKKANKAAVSGEKKLHNAAKQIHGELSKVAGLLGVLEQAEIKLNGELFPDFGETSKQVQAALSVIRDNCAKVMDGGGQIMELATAAYDMFSTETHKLSRKRKALENQRLDVIDSTAIAGLGLDGLRREWLIQHRGMLLISAFEGYREKQRGFILCYWGWSHLYTDESMEKTLPRYFHSVNYTTLEAFCKQIDSDSAERARADLSGIIREYDPEREAVVVMMSADINPEISMLKQSLEEIPISKVSVTKIGMNDHEFMHQIAVLYRHDFAK